MRIPPLGLTIDRDKGSAELRFSREPLRSCRAEASEIIKAHRAAMQALNTPFKPERFFDSSVAAWRAARAAADGSASERVEILDFLPFLALEMQPPKFRVNPTGSNYKSYSRAQFAYDVLRLRRAGGLGHRGMRMNFGVATGTTATQKRRVIYMEDENGAGEYKLTVYFTRQDGGGGQ